MSKCLAVRLLQAITLINVDLLLKVFYGINLRPVSQWVIMNAIRNMCSEVTLLELKITSLKSQ